MSEKRNTENAKDSTAKKTNRNAQSPKKREIPDSPEVREAIADLQAKTGKTTQGIPADTASKTVPKNTARNTPKNTSEHMDEYDEYADYSDDYSADNYDAELDFDQKDFSEDSEDEYSEDEYSEEYEDGAGEDYLEEYSEEDYSEEDYSEFEDDDNPYTDIVAERKAAAKAKSEKSANKVIIREKSGRAFRERASEKLSEKTSTGRNTDNKADKKSEKKSLLGKGKKKKKKDNDVVISLEGVTMSYKKGIPALDDVNLEIRRGEFVFIVGSSGSGKSTLIKLLLHELTPDKGTIMVNGFQVDHLRHRKVPKLRRSMGVVFQDFRLLPDMNVYENVAFAQRIIQAPAREMKRNVPSILAMVGLASKYKARPDELSGGEQQRVALARALVNNPPVLLADEPTGNLDPQNTKEMISLLEQVNKNGTTVIVVTHDEKMVNEMKKRVITIKKGIVVSDEERGGYTDGD